jgi:hypothetical protein
MVSSAYKLVALLAYVRADGRVCPIPAAWDRFWKLLPREEGKEAPVPLILGAWHTDAAEKCEVLRGQIEYAAREGVLDTADAFLRGLKPEDWSDGERL